MAEPLRRDLVEAPAERELRLVVRIRPIDAAALVSVLLHLALFTFTKVPPPHDPAGPVVDAPLNVVLAPPQVAPAVPPDVPQQPQAPAPSRPAPPVVARKPAPLPPAFPPPIAMPSPEKAPPQPSPQPQVDMMAAIQQRRATREAQEAAMARGPASPQGEPRDAAERNMQTLSGREGVGGVFQVLRKGVRTGEFAFNGFSRERGPKQWREVIEVDAGVGGDVELAMIRRMIELIRTHYQGDFQWESHRLGRIVVLSARASDQAGLEEFLQKEFFGQPTVNARRPGRPPFAQ